MKSASSNQLNHGPYIDVQNNVCTSTPIKSTYLIKVTACDHTKKHVADVLSLISSTFTFLPNFTFSFTITTISSRCDIPLLGLHTLHMLILKPIIRQEYHMEPHLSFDSLTYLPFWSTTILNHLSTWCCSHYKGDSWYSIHTLCLNAFPQHMCYTPLYSIFQLNH